jgi:ABC-type antimicrobial peptide transport system ATPase subunit
MSTSLSSIISTAIANSNGRFFSVSFIKKDGSLRKLVGRTGVTKALKGGLCTVNRDQYIIAYDVNAKGYRSINVNSIVALACNGERVYVTGKPVNA